MTKSAERLTAKKMSRPGRRNISVSVLAMRPFLGTMLLLLFCPETPGGQDYRVIGDAHFYNLEFNEATDAYSKLISRDSSDALAYSDMASAILYKELHRLGRLESSAYTEGNRFAREQRAKPSPETMARMTKLLDDGRAVAQRRLARSSRDDLARYALCTNATVRATASFMIDKAWMATLRHAMEAKSQCEQLIRANPDFDDAYLVLGVYEYGAASIPAAVRWMFAIGGLHGSKKKALTYVERVAEKGIYARASARSVLSLLYRREKRLPSAVSVLESLTHDYPRNYIFSLDLVSVYAQTGQRERALAVLKSVMQTHGENARTANLPLAAVKRRVQELEGQAK